MRIFFLVFALASIATSSLGAPLHMRLGADKTAPDGAVVFCRAYPGQCLASSVSQVTLTSVRAAELSETNAAVNAQIVPRSDPPGRDIWSVNVTSGDCEDYALTKRAHLIAAGWPASALLVAMAIANDGTGHALLIAVTDKGDFVLDNLHPKVMLWSETDYGWVGRMSSTDPHKWRKILPTA
jgi:predicted transglutaminase-like cysteine proteinase